MTDVPDTHAERAEAAAIRRRWVTLGEIVAIAGLIISALALWSSWADHRTDEAERRAEKAAEAKAKTAVLLTATPRHGGEDLALTDPGHPVQSITVTFPTAFGLPVQSSAPSPTIAARWFAAKLIAMTDGGADSRTGRLPVIIASEYWDGDRQMIDRAIYDIAWRTEGRLLLGRLVRLDGLILRERGKPDQARVDALWSRVAPAPRK
ncbi:hypothetical protein [Sphingomonas sp. 28-63-12]|uniref:hypothetical protein n=1 Tax=Sphingomonas sp. 28-63-12 TaxID=1970434 RepID=UPI000BD6B768|nr:MAG: hypothetical protein B7Y47_12170 [Sphingomonas sp. 28-63-12]